MFIFVGGLLLLLPLAPAWAQTVVATIPVGTSPVAVASNPLTDKIYVANEGSNTVTVIDGHTKSTVTVAVGLHPVAIAVNAVTDKIYVANRGYFLKNITGSVTVINGATNSTTTVIDPNATFPSAVAVNPVTNKIYVTNASHNVTVIDGHTNSTTTVTDRNGAFPLAVAVNPVTNKIYVANVNSANVTVIDGATNSTTTVPVTVPNVLGPVALAVNSVTDKIYVANNGVIRGSTNVGHVTVIDGRTNSTTRVTDPNAITPLALAMNSLTDKVYVTNEGNYPGANHGNVTVIDGRTNSTRTVTDPHALAPQDIAVNSLTNKIYVTNANRFVSSALTGNGGVTVINGSTNSTTAIIDPKAITDIPAPLAVDPVTDNIYVVNVASGNVTVIHDPNGTGTGPEPNATLSATKLTFAAQLVGTSSSAQSVTMQNSGTKALGITSIVASGDFHQTHTCGSSLAAGASCTINVTFKPTQIGTRTGTLSITDNAPGSPQRVSLTGTGTVVQFNPSSLAFHCHIKPDTCPPPPQTTTLTNTGSTTLSISGITITGSTAFSQTNTCRSSVVAKGSCTITVTFKVSFGTFGTFRGAVSVSDNGGGSPQQVTLSATKTKTGAGALAVRSAVAAHNTAVVPRPTGPSQVGTHVVHLVDSTRDDPFLAEGTKRELLVRLWYPATASQSCELAAYTSPAVWSYFSELAQFPLPEVRTNSCLDAPVTEGPHPVIVFTHGYTGTFTDYTFILEDLASRGYVIASVDHTYEATAVEFPHGRLVKSVFGSHLADGTWRRDEQSLSFAVSVRSRDLKFVVDELARLNGEASGPFAGKLDLTRVAVAGHSLGGLAALLGLKQDARFKTAVLLDASVPDGTASVTDAPVLVLAMGREQWSDEECRLWSDFRGPRFAVNLKGAEHLTPSDAVWLAKGAIKIGPMGPEKTIAAMRDYIAAFLDTNLRGQPLDPLLSGPSQLYLDAVVTTKDQQLCRQP
jgi:YVTN family beta-propeller protein